MSVTIRVPGIPQPQGSKTKTRWGGMRDANSERLTPWRNAVTIATTQTIGHHWRPLDGPIDLMVVFTLPKPSSAPKRRRAWATKKPDGDKLLRAVCDGLTDGRIWNDDAQVVHYDIWKLYAGDPGAETTPGAVVHVRIIDTDAEEPAA